MKIRSLAVFGKTRVGVSYVYTHTERLSVSHGEVLVESTTG